MPSSCQQFTGCMAAGLYYDTRWTAGWTDGPVNARGTDFLQFKRQYPAIIAITVHVANKPMASFRTDQTNPCRLTE